MPFPPARNSVSTPTLERADTSPRRARRLDPVAETSDDRAAREARSRESALVARLRDGDDEAYALLVNTYGPRMLAVARGYLPSPEDAEDVLQSALLLVFRFIHRFEGASRLSTWLHRIVVNCALMRIRSRNRHPEARLNVQAFEDDCVAKLAAHVGSSVADELAQRETRDRLLQAVGCLPDLARAAFRLRAMDGLTLAETSLLLGRSRTAIKTSVQRARMALRSKLAAADELDTYSVRRGLPVRPHPFLFPRALPALASNPTPPV